VLAVSQRRGHHFSKMPGLSIRLLAGLGVEGDGHAGVTVKHRSRARFNPTLPNLRQVHLIHAELFDEVAAQGFTVKPGDLGENITTHGIDLLSLPQSARLHIGDTAIVEITGLRNPCIQIDRFQQGLMQAMLAKASDGTLIRKSGIMSIVIQSGDVRPGDAIKVELPPGDLVALKPV
jgi:MOSC domain-containing protein YiiM